jgi:protein N-lysine methyltransferase METTL21D
MSQAEELMTFQADLGACMQHSSKRKRFARSNMKGKRALDLGSGAGLAGIAAAMVGCDTWLTDVHDVLPLLRRNVSANFATAAWANNVALKEQFGSLTVKELDWTKPEQLDEFQQPFDLILCTDCVYHETLVQDLLRVVLHCSDPKTLGVASGSSTL